MASPVTLMIRPGASGICDLVVRSTGNGRGRLALDVTAATMLLAQLGSNRRADSTDTLPNDIALLPAQSGGILARRGWPGDCVLAQDQRMGSRLWLLERGKADEETRINAIGYAAEAVAPIEAWRGISLQKGAVWRAPGQLQVTVTDGTVSISTGVSTK